MCIRDRSHTGKRVRETGKVIVTVPGESLAGAVIACGASTGAETDKVVANNIEMMAVEGSDIPVSYTHLDVYKRQYIAYVLVCVYALNGAKGFVQGFWQLLAILSVMNLIDRFWVDGYWVGHTNAWEVPGTEDLKPYITAKDKGKKWLFGTVGMAVISAALAAIMSVFIH